MVQHYIKKKTGGGGRPPFGDIKILLSSKEGTNKLLSTYND